MARAKKAAKPATQAPARPAGMTIAGTFYPAVESFTLGEARLIHEMSGVSLAGIEEALEASNPSVLAAVVLITMRRVDPKVTEAHVNALDLAELVQPAGSDDELEEDEAGPPADGAA